MLSKNVCNNRKPFAIIALSLLSSSTIATASWLDQGKELLQGLQGETTQTEPATKQPTSPLTKNLSANEIEAAFKQALTQGSKQVVEQLSAKGGFNTDPNIHIHLPSSLETVQQTLNKIGMGQYMVSLENKMNQAAEQATPQAKALFIKAIQDLSFQDVQKIYQGPKDSATQYLKNKTAQDIQAKMAPIVEQKLNEVGAISAYDSAMAEYKDLPFVPDVKANFKEHVTQKGTEGLFYYIAKEEAAIRENPLKQSTDLLKKVFGQ